VYEKSKIGMSFDKDMLAIYKKIPADSACELESLTSDSTPMRSVMKILTRLETGKFITILPGGKVIRKTK
jgi:hypothetical protein